MKHKRVTCTAPVNIAVVKYWGKRNEELILPTNDSLSVTLHQDQLRAKTTVMTSSEFTEDSMWLNGEKQSMSNPRVQKVLKEVRTRAGIENSCYVRICSENNFPTAAGLASSAAGYACLVYALTRLFEVSGDVSDIARLGSGSACRSVYGGFVAWRRGTLDEGTDCIAEQVAPETHWPNLHILLVVVNAGKKHTGSTEGMQTSVETSELLQHRIHNSVPLRMTTVTQAICDKDFSSLALETMKDSNQMHAVCLDTYPPISYMTDISHDIQRLVHALNNCSEKIKVAYTFDAGPNACLLVEEQDVPLVLGMLTHFFPPPPHHQTTFIQGLNSQSTPPPSEILSSINIPVQSGVVSYIIHTKIGPGPQVLTDEAEHLLNDSGLPC